MCPAVYIPMCAGGKDFGNKCEAERAGFKGDQIKPGKCPEAAQKDLEMDDDAFNPEALGISFDDVPTFMGNSIFDMDSNAKDMSFNSHPNNIDSQMGELDMKKLLSMLV